MAFLLRIFYKMFGVKEKGQRHLSEQEAAIQKLKESEVMLKKKLETLEENIEEQQRIINENNTGTAEKKKVAVQALRKKKRLEKELNDIEGKLSNVESQRLALENHITDTELISNMAYASKAMEAVHNRMDINKVDELIQGITEQQEQAQEISDAISKPMGYGEADEEEIVRELEEMHQQQDQLDRKLQEVDGAESVALPSVPSSTLPSRPAANEKDKEEMEVLKQWSGSM